MTSCRKLRRRDVDLYKGMEYWKIGNRGEEEIARHILTDKEFAIVHFPDREQMVDRMESSTWPWIRLVSSFDFHCVRKGIHWLIEVKSSEQIRANHRNREFKVTIPQFMKGYALHSMGFKVAVLLIDLRNNSFKLVSLGQIISNAVVARFPNKKIDLSHQDYEVLLKGNF